jgi:predicted transcriptional regulator
MRKPLHELGDLQREVMEIVWDHGEAGVHAVRAALAERHGGREPAYTTVLSVLQKLEKAGWLGHRKDGRSHVYSARAPRERVERSALGKFVERVFHGDRLVAFQHLLEDEELTDADLESLRAMIDARRGERAP